MPRWPEKATKWFERHPDPQETDEVLFGSDNTLFAVDEVDDDGTTDVENLRTGETKELTPTEYVGWIDNGDKQPLGIGITPQVEERAEEVADAFRRSPGDTFEMQSTQAQQTDAGIEADRVTDDALRYNLNPDRYDFENFDTPGGDASSAFDL
jgi:hypothetical protein